MTRYFIIVSGGPGIYVPCDKLHDKSWSNYVDNVLLLAKNKLFPKQKDEEVWWLVYKPAYEKRWSDDVAKKKESVKNVKGKGFTSYKDMLEKRAYGYGWKLNWLIEANNFWQKLQALPEGKISRVYYFGHAQNNLWLSLRHNGCEPVSPTVKEIISLNQILPQYAKRFQAGGSAYDANRSSRFYGCNTAEFAKKWANVFKVYAEGCVGGIHFELETHPSGGSLDPLSRTCTWKKYSPRGEEV